MCSLVELEKIRHFLLNELTQIQCSAESIILCISSVLGAVPPQGTAPSTELVKGVQWNSAHVRIAIGRAQLARDLIVGFPIHEISLFVVYFTVRSVFHRHTTISHSMAEIEIVTAFNVLWQI